MNDVFDLHISQNRLSATLSVKDGVKLDDIALTPKILNDWLVSRNLVFGIDQHEVKRICEDPNIAEQTITIASGIKPIHGIDSYLMNEVQKEEKKGIEIVEKEVDKKFNFRNILTIPTVKCGQLLATIIPPTPGSNGTDVYGKVIKARAGKRVRLKPGENIIFHMDKIFATTDGQVSITTKSVNVFPVFEVKGDLDLNTGNIDFIGNVTIHGNVPSEYEIKAGGDIIINGLVEGAKLTANGSIYISGGIAGQQKAWIEAGVDLHTLYINQAYVKAGNDIQIDNFIMYSEVSAGCRIIGKNSHIIGGKIAAGHSIEVGEVGNYHFARTELFVGNVDELIESEQKIINEIKQMKTTFQKLTLLKERLENKQQNTGKLTSVEEQMKKKQQNSIIVCSQKIADLEDELVVIRERMHHIENSILVVYDTMYPNCQVHFSKYSKIIQQGLSMFKMFLDAGEIISVPL